jgi:hypothetical protein
MEQAQDDITAAVGMARSRLNWALCAASPTVIAQRVAHTDAEHADPETLVEVLEIEDAEEGRRAKPSTATTRDVLAMIKAFEGEEAEEEEDDEEDHEYLKTSWGSSAGVGCVEGCKRDKHIFAFLISVGLLTLLLIFAGCALSGEFIDGFFRFTTGLWVVFGLAGLIYVAEALHSPTFRYLLHLNHIETVYEYHDRLTRTAPEVLWFIQCYHYETQNHTVDVYDQHGKFQRTETRTETVRVNTNSAHGELVISGWQDTSKPLGNLDDFQMTKMRLSKSFTADAGYKLQKRAFISANNRDTHYDLNEDYRIDGFKPCVLSVVDVSKKPCLAHWVWFLLAHLLVFLAVPYRAWLCSISGKAKPTISKHISTF